jgi:hypothetical protein
MKVLTLTLAILSFIAAHGQVDTVRWYYQNGNIASIQPVKNGELSGESIRYSIAGEVISRSYTKPKNKKTITTRYYKDGGIKAEYILDSFATISSKTYYQNRKLNRYYKQLKNGSYIKERYPNGSLTMLEISKSGQLISCMAYQQKDSTITSKVCYCGGKRVFWKSDHWEDQSGKEVNDKFQYRLKKYDSLGNKVTHIKQRANNLKVKANKRWVKIKTSDTFNVYVLPYQNTQNITNEVFAKGLPEGYPLLREPNPPRDTVIRKYKLKQLTDSTIHWKIRTSEYDSLGQLISTYANYGELTLQSDSTGSKTYGNSSNNIAFEILKNNPNKAKVVSQSHYSFYQTEDEIDVDWE